MDQVFSLLPPFDVTGGEDGQDDGKVLGDN